MHIEAERVTQKRVYDLQTFEYADVRREERQNYGIPEQVHFCNQTHYLFEFPTAL